MGSKWKPKPPKLYQKISKPSPLQVWAVHLWAYITIGDIQIRHIAYTLTVLTTFKDWMNVDGLKNRQLPFDRNVLNFQLHGEMVYRAIGY